MTAGIIPLPCSAQTTYSSRLIAEKPKVCSSPVLHKPQHGGAHLQCQNSDTAISKPGQESNLGTQVKSQEA